jgi:hypothetical protein
MDIIEHVSLANCPLELIAFVLRCAMTAAAVAS